MVTIEPADCAINALWDVGNSGEFTMEDLLKKCRDIPKMTMYHKMEKWREDGIVRQVKKRKNNKSYATYSLDTAKFEKAFGKVVSN